MIKAFLIVASICFVTVASAQQQQPSEFNIKLTPAELDIISEGLQTQPFGKVVPLINKMREQIVAQTPKSETKSEPEPQK